VRRSCVGKTETLYRSGEVWSVVIMDLITDCRHRDRWTSLLFRSDIPGDCNTRVIAVVIAQPSANPFSPLQRETAWRTAANIPAQNDLPIYYSVCISPLNSPRILSFPMSVRYLASFAVQLSYVPLIPPLNRHTPGLDGRGTLNKLSCSCPCSFLFNVSQNRIRVLQPLRYSSEIPFIAFLRSSETRYLPSSDH